MEKNVVRIVIGYRKEEIKRATMKTLDGTERRVLLKKYMQSGLNFYEARDKLDKFHDYLRDLRDELLLAGKNKTDVENKFKMEFEKLCQNLEKW